MDKPQNKLMLFYIYIFLAVTTFSVYMQVKNYEFIDLDDKDYIVDNQPVKTGLTLANIKWAFTTANESNWHPLTWISHMLDCQLFGLNPAGHHLTNVFFHIINTLLLFAILNAMTGLMWRSAFVAAAFALHPLHVESVAWVSERKDVLSTMFGMLTIAAYFYYTKKPSLLRYLPAILLFVLGLMSKPMLVTLPFILLLLDYWPLNRIESINSKGLIRPAIEKIPFFVLSVVSSIITFIAQQKGGSVIELTKLSGKFRLANAFVSYFRYIQKTIWPTKLSVFYPFEYLYPAQAVLAIISLIIISFLVIRFSRNHKYLLTGWFWYVGTLIPVIGLVQVGQQAFADRYSYIPSIGLFIIAAWAIPSLLEKIPYRRAILTAGSIAAVSILYILTYIQTGYWSNSMTLFQHSINVTKNNSRMYHTLGLTYSRLQLYPQAIEDFRKSIEIDPCDPGAYQNLSAAYNNMGLSEKAIEVCNKALLIKPDDTKSLINLGVALGQLKKFDDAIETFKKGIQANPNDSELYYNLAYTYAQTGQTDMAIQNYLKTIEINSRFAAAYCNLGVIYGQLTQYDKAIESLKKAIEIKPDYADAYYDLGYAYVLIGDKKSALEQYNILQKLDNKQAQRLYDIISK